MEGHHKHCILSVLAASYQLTDCVRMRVEAAAQDAGVRQKQARTSFPFVSI